MASLNPQNADDVDNGEQSVRRGRPTKPENQSYPLDNAIFQRKVLMSLSRITSRLEIIERKLTKLSEAVVKGSEEDMFVRAKTTDELKELEAQLVQELYEDNEDARPIRQKLTRAFNALALSAENVREHSYAILDYLMTEEVQVLINMYYGNNVPGMNYTNRIAFIHELPNLLSLILITLSSKWPSISDKRLKSILSERLRQATKRADVKHK